MKLVSARNSPVKYLVSMGDSDVRLLPLSQVKSANANGSAAFGLALSEGSAACTAPAARARIKIKASAQNKCFRVTTISVDMLVIHLSLVTQELPHYRESIALDSERSPQGDRKSSERKAKEFLKGVDTVASQCSGGNRSGARQWPGPGRLGGQRWGGSVHVDQDACARKERPGFPRVSRNVFYSTGSARNLYPTHGSVPI